MPTRSRTTRRHADPTESEYDDLEVGSHHSYALEELSDEEIEQVLFAEEPRKKGPINLPTVAGFGMIGVGLVYLLQQAGLWNGLDMAPLVSVLPFLAGILIIVLGLGVLDMRPRRKRVTRKQRRRAKQRARAEATAEQAKERVRTLMDSDFGQKMNAKRKGIKRSRDKKLFGVAGGLAEYFGVEPILVRIAFLILLFATSGVAVPVYVVLALLMPKPEPLTLEERITIIRDS